MSNITKDDTRSCPNCGQTIKAAAKLCRFCGAHFTMAVQGYCTHCHTLVTANEQGRCNQCGDELLDAHAESILESPTTGNSSIGQPTPAPPAPPSFPELAGSGDVILKLSLRGRYPMPELCAACGEAAQANSPKSTTLLIASGAHLLNLPLCNSCAALFNTRQRSTNLGCLLALASLLALVGGLITLNPLLAGAGFLAWAIGWLLPDLVTQFRSDEGREAYRHLFSAASVTHRRRGGMSGHGYLNLRLANRQFAQRFIELNAEAILENPTLSERRPVFPGRALAVSLLVLLGAVIPAVMLLAPGTLKSQVEKFTYTAPPIIPVLKPTETSIPPNPPLAQNAACVHTLGVGSLCLDENGWQKFHSEATYPDHPLTEQYLYDMTVCPDGRVIFLAINYAFIYANQAYTNVELPGFSSYTHIACNAAGDTWRTYDKGVSRLVNGSWEDFPVENLVSTVTENIKVVGIAVDANGNVWAATPISAASFDGQTWTVFETEGNFQEHVILDLLVDSHGNPWAAHQDGLSTFDGTQWIFYPLETGTIRTFAVDASDQVWIGTDSGLFKFTAQKEWQEVPMFMRGKRSERVQSIAIDTQGRVWVGTDWGLNILDGSQWITYQMHNSELPSNDITQVIVIAGGPTLPPAIEKAPGTLTGRVVAGSQPVSGALIEICNKELGMFFFSGDSPCDGSAFVKSAYTNENGRFTLEGLPTGYYSITIKTPEGKWKYQTDKFGLGGKQTLILPGETIDLLEMNIGQ